MAVGQTIIENPTTVTVAVGSVIAAIGLAVGWDAETQAVVANAVLGAALLVRLAAAAGSRQE